MSNIISFMVSNVKRVEAVQMDVRNEHLIILTGKNGQGKSSTIDAIQYALEGKKAMPNKVIREGEESAKVLVETDELLVKRTWTTKDTYISVERKDGTPIHGGPQELLNKLWNSFTFDPLQFEHEKPEKQIETLLNLGGLTELKKKLEQEIDILIEKRKPVNADFDKFNKLVKDLPIPTEPLPPNEFVISELIAERDKMVKDNQANSKMKSELEDVREYVKGLKADIKTKETQIEQLQKDISALAETLESKVIYGKGLKEKVEKLVDHDITTIDDKIANAELINAKIRKRNSRLQVEHERDEAYKLKEELTGRIEEKRAELKKIVKNAKFPVDGLGFNENGITYFDIEFSECSHADKIKISFAIGMALNPDLKAIFSKNADKLDEDNMMFLSKLAKENGYQFFLERVYENQLPAVIIEEGRIKGYKNTKDGQQ